MSEKKKIKPKAKPKAKLKAKPKAKKVSKYSLIYEWHKKKKLSKDPKEIIKDIKKFEVSIRKQHPEMDEGEVTDLAIGKFFAANKKRLTDMGGEDILYYLFKNTGPFDWVAAKRAQALAKYDADPEEAVSGEIPAVKLVYNEMGEVIKKIALYHWPLNRAGKPNKKLGEDLPEHGFLHNIGGIGLLKSEFDSVPITKIGKFIKKLEITNSGDFANSKSEKYIDVKLMNQWGITNLKVRENDLKKRLLRTDTQDGTSFDKPFTYNEDGEERTLNISKKSILSLFGSSKLTLDNLQEKFDDKVDWGTQPQSHSRGANEVFVSEVFVSAMDPGNDIISPSIAVASPEMGMIDSKGKEVKPIKVWWNDHLPFDFGEGSKIALFHRMKQNEIKDGDVYTGEWGPINFTAQGVIVLHREEVKIKKQKKEPKKEATGIKKIEPEIEDDVEYEDEEEEEEDIVEEYDEEEIDVDKIELDGEIEEEEEEEEEEELPEDKAKKDDSSDDELELDELDDELMKAFDSEEGFSEEELFGDL